MKKKMVTVEYNLNEKTLQYLIRFLIAVKVTEEIYNSIGYTLDKASYDKYRLVIVPSLFFHHKIYGTQSNLPILPLKQIEGVPLLYGKPQTMLLGNTRVVYADLIASTFFMLSRYEEYIRKETRDEHGRFPGKASLPYQNGFLHRPIVDEYGKILRTWLRECGLHVPEPEPHIRKVYLTHDLDTPFFCRSLRNVVRETLRGCGLIRALKIYRGKEKSDPFYTFDWLDRKAEELQESWGERRCSSILFVRGGGNSRYDRPRYQLQDKSIRRILEDRKQHNVNIGLHSSYSAGEAPSLVSTEKGLLEKVANLPVTANRHHFLSFREPSDAKALEKAGITDDFTMGYADAAGFRLGTSRRTFWIDPATGRLGKLILHPLLIMDCSLSEAKYMNLDYNKSLETCKNLIEKVWENGGELVLLWHNNSVSGDPELTRTTPWLRELYSCLIDYLKGYA